MADDRLLLGLDVGTSGAKALLVDAGGAVVAAATTGYPIDTPRPLWAEQDPADWWRASVTSMRAVLNGRDPRRVAGVGLTGQMHGLVALDRSGEVLRPAILWNDQRTAAQCAEITRRVGAARLLELTGNPVLPGFTAPKLLWLREHEPAVYARIAHALLPKDFLRHRLTGTLATDVSDASGTSLLDVRRRAWSGELLDALEVPPGWLPTCRESSELTGAVSAGAAAATGLVAGTPVVAGAGDQAAHAVGCGVVGLGVVSVALGTSGVVFAATESYRPEPEGRLHAFCHAVPGQWHLMGVMLSAAGSLRWFRDALGAEEVAAARAAGDDPYDRLAAAAAEAPAGSEGLLFLPYLSGERTPHPDPHARGAFVGLTLRHGKPHMVRAVLEGVAFGLRDSLELMRAVGVEAGQVRVSGGGARSRLWRQILADVFDREVVVAAAGEGSAYGAALLAAVGVGLQPDLATAAGLVPPGEPVRPGPAVPRYAEAYRLYRDLYPALAPLFPRLTAS